MQPHNLPPHSSIDEIPPWKLSEVIIAFVLAFVVAPAASLGLFYFIAVEGIWQVFIAHVTTYSAWVLILVWMGRHHGANMLKYLGLEWKRSGWYYTVYGLAATSGIIVIGYLLGIFADRLGWLPEEPYQMFPENSLRYIAAFAILMAPIPEEVIFRGFLQSSLYRYMKPLAAIIFASVLFTLFHGLYYGQWLAMAYVFLLGMLLGVVRYASGSTIPCIIAHFLNNIMAALVMLG